LPSVFAPNRAEYRRDVARRVRTAKLDQQRIEEQRSTGWAPGQASIAVGPHPVEHDPDLRGRMRAAAHAERVEREITTLQARATSRTHSLSDEFDAVLGLLDDLGYVDRRGWRLRGPGEMLAGTFHECDLLVVECVRAGLLDGLGPAELAGLVSVFVYEHRSPDDPPPPWFSSPEVRRRFRSIVEVSEGLLRRERERGIAEHRPPDPTFLAVAHAWVAGEGFAEVVGEEELTGGDFVRTIKQLVDLLGQLATVAPDPVTRATAGTAVDLAFRGVVADSALVAR
jgi:ATP-dependent RNA helicase HelY